MSALNETVPQLQISSVNPLSGKILLPGIALSSFSALLLELALTRLFSVVLFYHFAFLAISIALLGLGAGGVFAHLWKDWLGKWSTRSIAAATCALGAIVIPLVLEIVLHVPVSLELSWGNFLRLTAIYACSAVPFFLDWIAILGCLRKRIVPHSTTLRCRSERWSAGVSGRGAAAELDWRAECDSFRGTGFCDRCGGLESDVASKKNNFWIELRFWRWGLR